MRPAARAEVLEELDSRVTRLSPAMGRRAHSAGAQKLCPNDNRNPCLQRAFLPRLLLRTAVPCVRADHDASDPTRSDDFVPTTRFIGLCLAMDIRRCWARTAAHGLRIRRVRLLVGRPLHHWPRDFLFLADSDATADAGPLHCLGLRRASSAGQDQ